VINSHVSNHPDADPKKVKKVLLEDPIEQVIPKDTIKQELLRKYIIYARNNVNPDIKSINTKKL